VSTEKRKEKRASGLFARSPKNKQELHKSEESFWPRLAWPQNCS